MIPGERRDNTPSRRSGPMITNHRDKGDVASVIPDGISSAYVPCERVLYHPEFESLWNALNQNRRDYLDGWCYSGARAVAALPSIPALKIARAGVATSVVEPVRDHGSSGRCGPRRSKSSS